MERPPTIRECLKAMNYREALPGKWVKPWGWQLFTFSEERNEWANWFVAATGETSLWEAVACTGAS